MAEQSPQPVPVFVPPLALLLARAEALKESPLAEPEVVRIRDNAPCILMAPERAAEMIATRGYRDVNPENCWADWHRLRTELTGTGYLPKIVLCLVGPRDFPQLAAPILAETGLEHEFAPRDERMAEAFAASAFRVHPTLDAADFERIAAHESVLYVLSKNVTSREAPDAGRALLRAGARLLHAGAIALKCDSSGIAHAAARWRALAMQANDPADPVARWAGLFAAFVQYPIRSGGDLYTCGMHLLGAPDLIAAHNLLPVAGAVELFAAFALYLLAERGDGGFASGHTFGTGAAAPRFRVVWEPCTGYAEDDFFFNPFGRWRFTAP